MKTRSEIGGSRQLELEVHVVVEHERRAFVQELRRMEMKMKIETAANEKMYLRRTAITTRLHRYNKSSSFTTTDC
jgi:hypothetical protein